MTTPQTESELIAAAQSGDRAALGELLLLHTDALSRRLTPRMPKALLRVTTVEDILQQTFADVFRDIQQFAPGESSSFLAWVQRIAENRLRNAIKSAGRVKRGGDTSAFDPPAGALTSVRDLLAQVAGDGTTASVNAMRDEAIYALNVAIAELPDDYRQVVQLRFLEGRSLEETANEMNRTTDAVRALTDRAKRRLRETFAKLSQR